VGIGVDIAMSFVHVFSPIGDSLFLPRFHGTWQ
jgi:hypothetical protein